MTVNSASISGRLTKDIDEVKENSVYRFDLAFDQTRKNGDVWEKYPGFISCVMFGKRGKSIMKFMKKGTKVFVTGKIQYQTWNDKNGNKRNGISIVVEDIDICPSNKD